MRTHQDNGKLSTNNGVILIALLWVLTALSIIALSFSRESFVEVAAARNTQSLEKAYFIARAGIVATVYELLQRKYNTIVQQAELPGEPDPLDTGTVTGQFGGGFYRVDIRDESGKININFISEEYLRALVEAIGIRKPDSDIITDSILDWRDSDSILRPSGAEDEYYQTLSSPYRARNGRFNTIEELLLIRGITPDYYYGHPERTSDGSIVYMYGLSRYLSAYSPSRQINANYAALPVLLAIPDMIPQTAEMIYERCRTKPFKNLQDLIREIPQPLPPQALSYLTVSETGVYTLTASAHTENSKAKRVIRTVINLIPGQGTLYQTLYWNENIPDYESTAP